MILILGTEKWITVASTKDLSYTVKGLKEGQDYYFRVSAKNESGFGEAKDLLSSITVKEQLGWYSKPNFVQGVHMLV